MARWAVGDPVGPDLKGNALVSYRDSFDKMLTSIAESCVSGRMPAFRKFTLAHHSDLTEVRRQALTPVMEILKNIFAKARVEMELEISTLDFVHRDQ